MANTKQIKAAAVLNNAFSTTGGDGSTLIATGHALSGGGTLANRATTMADLNETSLEDALINISTFTDDRGLNIGTEGLANGIEVNAGQQSTLSNDPPSSSGPA